MKVSNLKNINLFVFFVMVFAASPVMAATGTPMPWEGPLSTIQASITGPVALVLSILGVAVAGGTLIYGGELNEFSRKLVMLALAISLVVAATNVISGLFGITSAVI
ncbi:conjugal transfer protein [Vibrio parahaemolyticus]|nr:conjugal transfer protein [Vibrio parahaemolyticus]